MSRAGISRQSLRGILAILALGWAVAGRAQESYYVMVFGAQQTPPRAKYSHSFAVFVKTSGRPGPGCLVETHTISWMPRSLAIRIRALLPECGKNLAIPTTFHWICSTRQRVSMWGPYQIKQDLYDRGLAQIALLESGQVLYKAVDTGYRSDHASNCIHAISSIVDGYRLRIVSPSFGETASYYITTRLEPWFIGCCTHDWVIAAAGLGGYPVIRRPLEPPRTGLVFSLLGLDPRR